MKPNQFFYILVAISVALVGGGGFMYYQNVQELRASTAKLSQTLADIEVAEEKARLLVRLAKDYEQSVEPILPELDDALPKQKEQAEVSKEMKSLGDASGVRIVTVSFASSSKPSSTSQTKTSGKLLALPITLNAEGEYPEIHGFLQRLENSPRENDIVSVSLTKTSGNLVTAQIDLNYYLKP